MMRAGRTGSSVCAIAIKRGFRLGRIRVRVTTLMDLRPQRFKQKLMPMGQLMDLVARMQRQRDAR